MTLYLITNGELKDGQVFTDLNKVKLAATFALPGETLRIYRTNVEHSTVAVSKSGVVCDIKGDVRMTCNWYELNDVTHPAFDRVWEKETEHV